MASPTIISRPNKVVDGFDSDWVACGGRLPVQYEIQNTKFPTNSDDTPVNITAYQDNGGFVELLVTSTSTFLVDDFVSWEIVTADGTFTGINRVIDIDTITVLTLDIPFNTVTGSFTSGSIQKYYNNYAIEVRIYAGIDSSHPLSFFDPTELVSTIKQIPESDNITRVDVSQIVKTKLSAEKNVIGGNDLNAWKDFYIEFREVFTGSSTSFIDDSANVYHAVYGVLQFRNPNGGNMADFVSRSFAGEFMTDFQKPVIYPNISTLSILLESVNDLTVEQLDKNGATVQSDVLTVTNNGYGLYRIPLTFTQAADAESLNIFLL